MCECVCVSVCVCVCQPHLSFSSCLERSRTSPSVEKSISPCGVRGLGLLLAVRTSTPAPDGDWVEEDTEYVSQCTSHKTHFPTIEIPLYTCISIH